MFTLIIPTAFETTTLFAQSEFLAENQKQQVYYDSLLNVLAPDSMQGTGYTQYQRWYRYWAPKLSSNYDFDDYQSDLLNYANNYVAPLNNGASPNWRFIGPNDIPSIGTSKGTGQIHYIYRSSNDQESKEILYACSPVGGLFKSIDNGENWFNLGTDKGLPRSGVSSVVVDSRSPSYLYVTTGNGEGFDGQKAWQTAIGVWRSTDNGYNWENIGLDTVIDSNNQNHFVYHMRKVIEVNDGTDSTYLVVTTTEGLYGTTNAKKQCPVWKQMISGEFYDVVQDPNNKLVFASGSDNTGIYKYDLTSDVATKIFDIDTVTLPYDTMAITKPQFRRISLNIARTDSSNYLFAIISNAEYYNTIVYRYETNTGNWHKFLGTPFTNGYARKMGWAIRPYRPGVESIHILGTDVMYPLQLFHNGLSNDDSIQSIDANDVGISPHYDLHYLFIEDDGNIWAGTDGGIYKGHFVNDSLIDWEPKSNGLAVSTIEFLDARENTVTSGQFDCGSNVYTSDNEINWDIIEKTGGDGFQNIIQSDTLFYLSNQSGGVYKYQNGTIAAMHIGYFPVVTHHIKFHYLMPILLPTIQNLVTIFMQPGKKK